MNLEFQEEDVQEALVVIRAEGKASTSLLQRQLRWGFVRACAVLDELEKRGAVGPMIDGKPREVSIGIVTGVHSGSELRADSARLDFLEKLILNCPHAEFDFNDDPDIEDQHGKKPLGFRIRVEGCETVDVNATSFRECVDKLIASGMEGMGQ